MRTSRPYHAILSLKKFTAIKYQPLDQVEKCVKFSFMSSDIQVEENRNTTQHLTVINLVLLLTYFCWKH